MGFSGGIGSGRGSMHPLEVGSNDVVFARNGTRRGTVNES